MNAPNNFGPTPPHILSAIHEIAAYLRDCNLEQAIISHTGGASFRLKDIYDEIDELLRATTPRSQEFSSS